ncbi:MAG: hypothetical protein D6794_00675 [Deltaproteobacteria bacterium]|nr:MAG: hypothetical protein D6794_00675 [Deltaproteobacteria bacterium]
MPQTQSPSSIEIGRLLRAGMTGFVAGCRVSQVDAPSFGALVRAPLTDSSEVFGLIYDIRIEDDGLVKQLVTAEGVDEYVIADNRLNRNVPIEMSVLSVGYREAGRIYHLLPPRPPLSLDTLYLCPPEEVRAFTAAGRFGYLRLILQAKDAPVGELLAAHIKQAAAAHADPAWKDAAIQEIITLLRDDYPALMGVLSALAEV